MNILSGRHFAQLLTLTGSSPYIGHSRSTTERVQVACAAAQVCAAQALQIRCSSSASGSVQQVWYNSSGTASGYGQILDRYINCVGA